MMNERSATRRTRHREADLAGLLVAAERVFCDKGYHGTSIRDIAMAAGFSVGGVYQFFPSKDALYLRIVESQWDDFLGLLDSARQAGGFTRQIEALTAAMFKAFEERRGFFRFFMADRGRLPGTFSEDVAARIGQRTRRLREQLVALMQRGVDEGVLRRGDPSMFASAYMGIVHTCIYEALASGAATVTRPPSELLSLFLGGAAREGQDSGR